MKIRLCAFADEGGTTIEEQIEALRANNINLVEVRSIDGKNISKITEDEAADYAEKFRAAGIEVWSLGSPLAKAHIYTPVEKEKAEAMHLCRLAAVFGTDKIRGFSYYTLFPFNKEKRVVEKLKPLLEILEYNGVDFCHENDTLLYGGRAKYLKKLLADLPSLKTIYDPANFIISGESPDETLAAFAGKAFYFHIKDAVGKKVVPAGYGDAKIDKLIKGLERDTVFSIEPHLMFFKGGAGFEKYDFKTKRGRFDCAADSIKKLLTENGFAEKDGYFEKIKGE
ncbi:MAG: sugar phosphate isomerase/epimerase [Clostridia bacterium]|nr:sugar phosphate isomerase/epimerase [Clostridia bacterium]